METGAPISVVMPVYNGGAHLDAAIRSIVEQTWRDFEFVILDDGSTDDTEATLVRWASRDPRIRLARSAMREGWGGSSDRVARLATAPVCARMDADDVAHPERLARQWAVLREHPDVIMVGTLWEGIDDRGLRVRPRDRQVLLRHAAMTPFPHGSIMFRRAAFLEIGGYRRGAEAGEDQDLCRRMVRHGRVAVLVEALHQYRFHAGSTTRELLSDATGRGLDQVAVSMAPPWRADAGDAPPLARPVEACRERALYYAIACLVWAGERPGVGALRSVARTGLSTPGAFKAALLTAGAWLSPAAARLVMRLALRARDRRAGRLLGPREMVDWEPPWAS